MFLLTLFYCSARQVFELDTSGARSTLRLTGSEVTDLGDHPWWAESWRAKGWII